MLQCEQCGETAEKRRRADMDMVVCGNCGHEKIMTAMDKLESMNNFSL